MLAADFAGEKKPNIEALLGALKACSRTRDLERGKQVHSDAVECRHHCNIYVRNAIMNMYAKCGSMVDAYQVLDSTKHPTVVSWNVIILGYADNGQGRTALDMFSKMRTEGPAPDSLTLVGALKACIIGRRVCNNNVRQLHNFSVEIGCSSDVYVQSTLVDMYAKAGSMVNAREVFNGIKHPNVVSWTALIMGYADNGQAHIALDMFTRMKKQGPAPNSITLVAALKACKSLVVKGGSGCVECRNRGKEIHNFALRNSRSSLDVQVQNSLVDMYANCGSLVDAREVFDGMKNPSVVSWTALILGYVDNGQGHTALKLFVRMRSEGPAPDSIIFGAVLRTCGLVGALEFGRTIHLEIIQRNEITVLLVSCLVDFYAKCGSLVEAKNVFDLHCETRNIVTWNTLLTGFSICGNNEAVFELFDAMQDSGCQPNDITFLCILTCCSHASLLIKGKECFDAMSTHYGVVPTVKHYTCMIDLFGRMNKLDAAMNLLERMPCSPNDVTWTTILSACRKWKNVEIGRVAFQSLIDLNDRNETAYVLMGQIYASEGMLQEQQKVMRHRKKVSADRKTGETSCWTNEAGDVHTFSVTTEDRLHPQIHEIWGKWESMAVLMGYRASVSEEVMELCGHSEKLALVCALINTEPRKTVRIVKNMRVCDDCHAVIAIVSKLECRSIICRDASRIHVFSDGLCSCGNRAEYSPN